MIARMPAARFDALAVKVADGTADAIEREEFISAAQKDREILGRLSGWIDGQIKDEAQKVILNSKRPKPRGTVAACGACGGSGLRVTTSDAYGIEALGGPCSRCAGSGRML